MTLTLTASVPFGEEILTADALDLVERLEREFGARRRTLLAARAERQLAFDAGERPTFRAAPDPDFRVAPTPADLQRRWVEITGPAEPRMMINALNSGADCFMADLEDSLSPTFTNIVGGQAALRDAVRRRLTHTTAEGREYRLNDTIAQLLVRPRGWHLPEGHVLLEHQPVSASLFDIALFAILSAREQVQRGVTPAFYLPKLESADEAALWNDVFCFVQDAIDIPRGTFRATVLIETITAAFEMDAILYELREHAAGLNAGRWDYIFSVIKKFREDPAFVLPDRAQVTMTVPFMRAYTELLVQTCHRRGAHAIGGMSALIPSRRDAAVNEVALSKVAEDKRREAGDGFDGTWVAHPDLVPVARAEFEAVLGERANQKERMREDVNVSPAALLDVSIPGSSVSLAGVRANVDVGLRYLQSWLAGTGAAAIHGLMEDVATAEISRAQLWQWRHHNVALSDGGNVDDDLYRRLRDELVPALGGGGPNAAELLDELVLDDIFEEFLTLRAYPRLG
ncbi:MAG: malate synthase [Gaiellales bacterium]|nr:malate synthase [Gaiellales bacterium]